MMQSYFRVHYSTCLIIVTLIRIRFEITLISAMNERIILLLVVEALCYELEGRGFETLRTK
jgi:hypothetical protein